MDKNILPLGITELDSWVRENQRNIRQAARQSKKTRIIFVIDDNYQWDVYQKNLVFRFPRWLALRKGESHLTKYSTFPFLFRNFRIFSAQNTVSLLITIACGVDSFVFSWSDSLFDSFSFWGCGDSCVSILTGFKSVSL